MELVTGAAVLCEEKGHFIEKIFSLDDTSQEVLKGMVERVMHRTSDLEGLPVEQEQDEDPAYLIAQLKR